MPLPETAAVAEDVQVPPLTIQLFGPFEVYLHGQPLPRLRSRKGLWLLALLTLRSPASGYPAEVDRSWLAATLWPDSAEAAAYASLRNCLKDLRRALGPEAVRLCAPTPRTLCLNLEGVDVDVFAFDAALAAGDAEGLERAANLYRGALLEGCAEEWVIPERLRREEACLAALERLALQAMERGEPAVAERWLCQVVTLDPLRETAQRALMAALAAGGNTAAATQVYRELRLRLHREVNAEPDPETRALYEQLRAEARAKADGGMGRRGDGATDRVRDEPAFVSLPVAPSGFPRQRDIPVLSRPVAPSLPTGTITFLFTDIEGSSQLWERYPEAMRVALDHHDALLRQAIQRHGGSVFKTVGDAFYAAFDAAPAAVTAALAAQRALEAEEWGQERSDARGGALRVRMALHTGIAEERGGDYFGPTLNRVARLLDVGHGGQVLLTLPTEQLVRDDLPEGAGVRRLGEHRLRDLVRPEQVFQLLHPDLPAAFPPLRSLASFTHNLPVQWTSFVGREQEIAELKRLLPTTHLLTLTGAGGCGKTRLALQVAADLLESYPDGAWVVELAGLADPALVPQSMAAALGISESPGRTVTATLIEHLRARSLLLVLDNCEHLLATCSQLTGALLSACPNLRILATSRERLGLTGERIYPVPTLSLPELPPADAETEQVEAALQSEAVRLFVERATYSQPQFALSARNSAAVSRLCRRLDGIPLALELAAARVKALPVEQLAGRLDDAFRLLTGGSRAALPRHQTLRALIDWSYDLLSKPEQLLLRRLSVFAGGWTLEAVEAVCSDFGLPVMAHGPDLRVPLTLPDPIQNPKSKIQNEEVLDLLTSLIEKSLVLHEDRGPEPRYRLLETVRHYAQDRLREAGAAATVHGRHRDWYLALAEQAEPELRRSDQLAWVERLETEQDNLRAALDWCVKAVDSSQWSVVSEVKDSDPELTPNRVPTEWAVPRATDVEAGVRLAWSLWQFWSLRDAWTEGRYWLEKVRSRATDIPAGLLARAFAGEAHLARFTGFQTSPRSLLEEGLRLATVGGDRWLQASLLFLMGMYAREQGKPDEAAALGEQSLALAREVGDPWLTADPLLLLGMVAWQNRGDFEQAELLMTESLALVQQVGDRAGMAIRLHCLGMVSMLQGRLDEAATRCKKGLSLSRDVGYKRGIIFCLHGLTRVNARQGRAEKAARIMGVIDAQLKASGHAMPPVMRAQCDQTVEVMRESLGETAYAAAWTEGQAMPLEAAITFALAME